MPASPAPSPDPIHRADRTALRVSAAIALACAVVGLVAPVAAAVVPLLTD